MRLVIVESPYAGDIEKNTEYARAAMRDCLLRGEAPMASHLLYTQPGVLRDEVPEERELGMEAGWEWMIAADAAVFYQDHGISSGMNLVLSWAKKFELEIEFRYLHYWKDGESLEILVGGTKHNTPGTLFGDGCWLGGEPDATDRCPSHHSTWKARYYTDGRRDERVPY